MPDAMSVVSGVPGQACQVCQVPIRARQGVKLYCYGMVVTKLIRPGPNVPEGTQWNLTSNVIR